MADRPVRRAARRLALLAALLVPAALGAQARPTPGPPPDSLELEPGRRIRVQLGAYSGRIAGVIDSVLATGFVLDTVQRDGGLPFLAPGPAPVDRFRVLRVGYDEIASLEVSRGTSRARGMLLWGAVGLAAGGLLAGIDGGGGGITVDDGSSFTSRALPGAIVGAVLGGAIGWFTGRERWAPTGWP